MIAIPNTRQGFRSEAEWKQARRSLITATDAAVIIGVNPWKKPLQLYAEKRALLEDPEETEAMEWGLLLEDPIAARYGVKTRRTVLNPRDGVGQYYLDVSKEHPWMGATIDRDVEVSADSEPPPAEGRGVLEIKTASAFRRDDWLDTPPIYYQVQVQHQLATSGCLWGSIAVLIGGQRFRYYDVRRNDGFIVALLDAEYEFWDRVRTGHPPDPEGTEGDLSAVRALYKQETEAVTELPASLLEWDETRARGEQLIEQGESLKRLAESQIMLALGDAAHGVFPNGVSYSWKTVTRRGHVVRETTYRQLRRHGGK